MPLTNITGIARSEGDPRVERKGPSSMTGADRLARALGWFSIGLGITELVAPGRLARTLGIDQAGAVGEVVQHGAARQSRGLGDHRVGRGGVAPLHQEAHGGVDDVGAGAARLGAVARQPRPGRGGCEGEVGRGIGVDPARGAGRGHGVSSGRRSLADRDVAVQQKWRRARGP